MAVLLLILAFCCLALVAAGKPAGLPTIISFNVDRNTIHEGENATLVWVTNNSTSVVIVPDVEKVALKGSINVTPAKNMIC